MRKVRLDLDGLEVESFATTGGRGAERGTVKGHDSAVGTWESIDTSQSEDGMCACMPGVVPSRDAC